MFNDKIFKWISTENSITVNWNLSEDWKNIKWKFIKIEEDVIVPQVA